MDNEVVGRSRMMIVMTRDAFNVCTNNICKLDLRVDKSPLRLGAQPGSKEVCYFPHRDFRFRK